MQEPPKKQSFRRRVGLMNESFKFLPVTMVRNLQVPNPPSGQLCSRNFDDDHSLHYLVYNNRIVQTTERCFGGYDGSNAQNIMDKSVRVSPWTNCGSCFMRCLCDPRLWQCTIASSHRQALSTSARCGQCASSRAKLSVKAVSAIAPIPHSLWTSVFHITQDHGQTQERDYPRYSSECRCCNHQ